jgi:hypothetical protein
MAESKAKVISSGDKALPCFISFWIGKLSDKYLRIRVLLYHVMTPFSTSYKIVSTILSRLSPYVDYIFGFISVGFDVTDQLLIRYFAFVRLT